MNTHTTIGLLPLYLKLYDKTAPSRRDAFAPFLQTITDGLAQGGNQVISAPICCVESEVTDAVALFERESVDIIVSVHLAYSPSLESVEPLTKTEIPLLFLDTTMDHRFGPDVDPSRIAYNHGIHGVQDLASVLRRRGRAFEIAAGHVTESPVLERARDIASAAKAAKLLRSTRALLLGDSFVGMGDFAVAPELMRQALGVEVDSVSVDTLAAEVAQVTQEEVDAELERDAASFQVEVDPGVHQRTLRVCLGLRKLLEQGGYTAFSLNFMAFNSPEDPVSTVPFLEACKAMAKGVGYAGEGDVLTASLVGALAGSFGQTTFTEIFCPDWAGNTLFMSHMGEMNPDIAGEKPRLIEFDFPYTDARNPAVLACGLGAGPATLVNLAPGPGDSFGIVAAQVEVEKDKANLDLRNSMRGWIRPSVPLHEFLEAYSRNGGTHHSALMYGDHRESIRAFGAFAGLDVAII